MVSGFCSLYCKIHYIEVCYIKIWEYLQKRTYIVHAIAQCEYKLKKKTSKGSCQIHSFGRRKFFLDCCFRCKQAIYSKYILTYLLIYMSIEYLLSTLFVKSLGLLIIANMYIWKKSQFSKYPLTNFQTFHKFKDAFVELLFKSSRPANGTVKLSTKGRYLPSLAKELTFNTFQFPYFCFVILRQNIP